MTVPPYTSDLEAGTTVIHVDLPAMPIIDAIAASSSRSPVRRVHFGSVTTRYYQHVLGDHPVCSDGLPLTFGWTYDEYHEYDGSHWYCNDGNSGINSGIQTGDWNCTPTTSTTNTSPNMTHTVPTDGHTCTPSIEVSPNMMRSQKSAPVPKLTILARMAILLESGLSEEEIVKCIHMYHRNRRRMCQKDKRARLWMGILQSFGFDYTQ